MLRLIALLMTFVLVGCSDSASDTPVLWQATHVSSDGTAWAGPPRTTIEEATADADTYINEKSVDEDAVVVARVPDGAYPSMAYMMSFTPIERDLIAEDLGVELVELTDPTRFIGTWSNSIRGSKTEPHLETYRNDGTLTSPSHTGDGPPVKWEFRDGVLFETFWCPPMPEYGVTEGDWESLAYQCAGTIDGRIVLWNSDGSVVHILTPETP